MTPAEACTSLKLGMDLHAVWCKEPGCVALSPEVKEALLTLSAAELVAAGLGGALPPIEETPSNLGAEVPGTGEERTTKVLRRATKVLRRLHAALKDIGAHAREAESADARVWWRFTVEQDNEACDAMDAAAAFLALPAQPVASVERERLSLLEADVKMCRAILERVFGTDPWAVAEEHPAIAGVLRVLQSAGAPSPAPASVSEEK